MEEQDPLPSWETGVDCEGVAEGVDRESTPFSVF